MRHDVSKIISCLNDANNIFLDICREIYKSEVDIDDIITSVARESNISFSDSATSVFKLKESLNSLIADISDEGIKNNYLDNFSSNEND